MLTAAIIKRDLERIKNLCYLPYTQMAKEIGISYPTMMRIFNGTTKTIALQTRKKLDGYLTRMRQELSME